MKYEYKCVRIRFTGQQTEEMLNILSNNGWELVCSYAARNEWLILRRIIK